MRILFTMLAYDDVRKGIGFYSNFVSEVKNLGHDITVVAPSLDGQFGLRVEGDVSVLRVKTGKLFNVHPVIKGISNMRLPAAFQKALARHLSQETFDWVVSPTPPITLAPLIQSLKAQYKCNSYLILRDIFPQNARDLGIINNSLIFNFFRRKERHLYKISDAIGCMSQGNIDYITRHNPELDSKKLTILSNWIAAQDSATTYDREIEKSKSDLAGKFVALFGGNFGRPQKIESIIELADSVKETHPDIVFLLVGNGTERDRIKNLVAQKQLTSVILKDRMPQEEYLRLAASCDIGMVNLSEKFTIPNIPSRTFAYWASSLPVLACVDANTDLDRIIATVEGGLSSITGDLESYRQNLLKLHGDSVLRTKMGRNGLQAVKQQFETKIVAQEFVRQLAEFQ